MCPIDIRFDLNSAYKLLDYIGNQLSNPKTCAEFKRKLKQCQNLFNLCMFILDNKQILWYNAGKIRSR